MIRPLSIVTSLLVSGAAQAFGGYSADAPVTIATASSVQAERSTPFGLEWATLIAIAALSLAYWGWSSWWHHRHPHA